MAETEKPKATPKPKSTATRKTAAAKPKAATTRKTSAKPAAKTAVKSTKSTAKSASAKAAPKTAAKGAVTKTTPAKGKTQSKVKDEMNNFKEQAADKARSAAERGKDKATEAVGGLGKMIRESAASIDESVGKNYGDYARSAADAVEGFAEKVDAKNVDDIVNDARDFVRKSPALAIGAAAAVGFMISRLVRSGRDDT